MAAFYTMVFRRFDPSPFTASIIPPMAETKPLVLECPDCSGNREFRYSGYFTMGNGEEAHVRSCEECGFKRHFTPEGIHFSRKRNRNARKFGLEITPKKVSTAFLVKPRALIPTTRVSNLNNTATGSLMQWGMKLNIPARAVTGVST